jgi:hypothetical protein
MFKVLGIVPKHNNPKENHWIRMGTAYVNRDNSINIYLEAVPSSFQLQLRELEEEDFRKRDAPSADTGVPFPARPNGSTSPQADGPPF